MKEKKTSVPSPVLLIGLGNPKKYIGSRHHIGQKVVIDFVEKNKGVFTPFVAPWYQRLWSRNSSVSVAEVHVSGATIVCAISDGFMNEAGLIYGSLIRMYGLDRTFVVHDDIFFPPGIVRYQWGHGHGGHNGVRNIIDTCNSELFGRIRIGVGRGESIAEYVLQKMPDQETSLATQAFMKNINGTLSCSFQNESKNYHRCFPAQ
ncbi:MAG: aminoacyl-tRNA hydrolase [Alphaproteobacteria bacterium]|nr:aminoacyl-tRNA hydrolase [Alphaproteobacteria bacterium]